MKLCKQCKQTLPTTEYYAYPSGSLMVNCKDCTKKNRRIYRIENPDKVRAQDRKKHERHKERRLRQMKEYRERINLDPEWQQRRQANIKLGNAVRDGRIQKPESCQECGKIGRIEGHHEDYGAPLSVIWLCPGCHRAQHNPLLLPF